MEGRAAVNHPDGPDGSRDICSRCPSKTVKNRVHLDVRLRGDDLDEVVERFKAKGATYLHDGRQGPNTWVTLADPEGNELCLS